MYSSLPVPLIDNWESPDGFLGPVPDAATLSTQAKRALDRQNAYLKAFTEFGTISKSAEMAGISIDIIRLWNREDYLGFAVRYKNAEVVYRESWELEARTRLKDPTGNRGSDILLMGMLNANWPEKWNRNLQVIHDVPSEVLKSLQALQKQAEEIKAELPASEPKVVEGQARKVLPWEE